MKTMTVNDATAAAAAAEEAKPAPAEAAEMPNVFEWTRAAGGELVCDLCPNYPKVSQLIGKTGSARANGR